MPRQGGEPKPRNKTVVDIVRPHISPDAYSGQGSRTRNVEEWMLICQHRAQLGDNGEAFTETVDWLEAGI